MSVMDHDDDY
jgi:hypothetical protein